MHHDLTLEAELFAESARLQSAASDMREGLETPQTAEARSLLELLRSRDGGVRATRLRPIYLAAMREVSSDADVCEWMAKRLLAGLRPSRR